MTVFENAEVSEPCPMCGRNRGRVLAGEHQFVRDAENLLRGSGRDAGELEELAELLRGSRERGDSADAVRGSATGEAPRIHGLEELLGARPERVDMARSYALLIATLGAIENRNGAGKGGRAPSRVVYDSSIRHNVTAVRDSSAPGETGHARHKVGRNDACSCGSGRKYKKCHGSPTGGVATA